MRLECIVCNGLHGLALQLWMGRNSALYLYISTPRLGVLESPNHNCSTFTVPMSHCWVFSHGWGEIQPMICTFQHQDWVYWSPQTITAAP
eukprot:scaffold248420_cov82-Cyclotella_meneghiniana.AAC.7